MNIAVTIPVYKENISDQEYISLKSCLTILFKYEIVFFAPIGLDVNKYISICDLFNVPFRIEYFDSDCFISVSTYNNLMLSSIFYDRFLRFDYILIYQLDAFVFRDELEEWCSYGFDYIGAPIHISCLGPLSLERKLLLVGNGGFSLRKVESFFNLLKYKKRLLNLTGLMLYYTAINKSLIYKSFFSLLGILGFRNSVSFFVNKGEINEDLFYSIIKYGKQFKFDIPPADVAMKFSFEENPSLLFLRNNRQLPFGCHAWFKYDYSFWNRCFSKISL